MPFLWFKNVFKWLDFGVLEITVQACSHLDMQESCLLFLRVRKYPRARAGAIAQVAEEAERMQKPLGVISAGCRMPPWHAPGAGGDPCMAEQRGGMDARSSLHICAGRQPTRSGSEAAAGAVAVKN